MRTFIKTSLSILLAISMLVASMLVTAVFADEEIAPIRVELENGNATAKKSDGTTWAASDNASLKTVDGKSTVCAKYVKGDAGSTITTTVEVATAGTYAVSLAYRYNENYYIMLQVKVDGENVGDAFSTQKHGVPGCSDTDNLVVNHTVANVALTAGTHTLSMSVVEIPTASNDSQGAVLLPDAFTLTYVPENLIRYEAENTPFTAIDGNGETIATSNAKGTWAWSLQLSTTGITNADTISGKLAYFRSGLVGGTINYTIDVETAGTYGLSFYMRPNDQSYCTIQVLVNGEKVGMPISLYDQDTVNGIQNEFNTMRNVYIDNVALTAGNNTVSIMLYDYRDSDPAQNKNSGFAIDYIELSDPVDESLLVPTVAEKTVTAGKYYQARKNAEDPAKSDYRLLAVVPLSELEGKTSITFKASFSNGTDTKTFDDLTLTTVYTTVRATAANWIDEYHAEAEHVIFGVVVTGVPAGYMPTGEYTVN